jgi:hypothetical protein
MDLNMLNTKILTTIKIFILTILFLIIQGCCSSVLVFEEPISIRNHYKILLDSLKIQHKDFIIYYKGSYNHGSFQEEVIYSFVKIDSLIEISKINNIFQFDYISSIKFDYSLFDSIYKLVNINDTFRDKGFQTSGDDSYNLNLHIKDLNYSFNSSINIYDNQALNYIKAILFDIELIGNFRKKNE